MEEKNPIKDQYRQTAESFKDGILALIPDNPSILSMTDPWDLFKIKDIDELVRAYEPSLAQAGAALSHAKREYNENQNNQAGNQD
jgi:hypothetical protein